MLNRYEIIGNLGGDSEVRTVGDTTVVSFTVAVTEKYKTKSGESKENTTWVRCSWWGMDKMREYLRKGVRVFVEGQPRATAWLKDGTEPVGQLELKVNKLVLLSRKEDGGSSSGSYGQQEESEEEPF